MIHLKHFIVVLIAATVASSAQADYASRLKAGVKAGGGVPPAAEGPKGPTKKVQPPSQSTGVNVDRTANAVANGHAFQKHVQLGKEFPEIKSRNDFKAHVKEVLERPAHQRRLSGGRSAYWHGDGTVVILNPKDPDKGTAFRPKAGKGYFDRLE